MIDYCIKVPEREEYEKGHKYPYNSCEILCSINGFNLDKLSNNKNEEKNANNEENEHLKEEKNEEVRNGKKEEREPQRDINIHKELEYEKDQKHLTENKKEKNINLVYSLFDYFFSFLQNESSLNNDVLVGYFSKITNYLIKTETKIVLDYILIYKNNIISSLLSNIHNYSIANIIKNILNALSEEESPEANDKYMLIVNKLIEQFSLKENDDNTIEIICDLIINSIIYNNRFKH